MALRNQLSHQSQRYRLQAAYVAPAGEEQKSH